VLPNLGFGSSKHLQAVHNLPPLVLEGPIYISTHKIAAGMVLKELFKNAYRNTDPIAPMVSINVQIENDEKIKVIMSNNLPMPESLVEWFNHGLISPNLYDSSFSKRRMFGLRGVRRWYPQLGWNVEFKSDKKDNITQTIITIPVNFSRAEALVQ
jgi:hypothetical protein